MDPVISPPCSASGHKRHCPGKDVPCLHPSVQVGSRAAPGPRCSEPRWHCGEEGKLSKPDKWLSWMTFFLEHRAPGRELLIAGSRAECQQPFRQEAESCSCLLCIRERKKGKNVITLYKILQKWTKCDLLLTLSATFPHCTIRSQNLISMVSQKAIPSYLADLICLRVESSQLDFN